MPSFKEKGQIGIDKISTIKEPRTGRGLFSERAEKSAQKLRRLVGEQTGEHSRAVAEALEKEVYHAAARAADRIGRAVVHRAEARVDDGTGAHRAGLERDVHRAAVKTPAASRRAGGAYRLYLSVGRCVASALATIAPDAENAAVRGDYDAAHRHLAIERGLGGQAQSELHVFFVLHRITSKDFTRELRKGRPKAALCRTYG